jgi:hypothetical protein
VHGNGVGYNLNPNEHATTLSQKVDLQYFIFQGKDGSADRRHFCHRHDASVINEDDPRASALTGQQIMFFPLALGAALVASYFNPLAGSYALSFVVLALRVWQRRWHRNHPANP